MGNDDRELVWVAASVLCLLDGQDAEVTTLLAGMAPAEELERVAASLRQGSRERRARGMAAPLGRLALDLESWSLS